MTKPQEILVPVDFDESSWAALKKAALLAKTWNSKLHVFHVLKEVPYDGASQQSQVVEFMGRLEEEAVSALDKKVEELVSKDLEVDSSVTTGVPYKEILHQLKNKPSDLVLLGPDRHTALTSWVLGRHTETVLRNTKVPVWVEKEPHPTPTLPKDVAFLTDFSPASLEAAQQALEWVRLFGAKIHLVHILEPFVMPAFSLMDPQEYEKSLANLASEQMEGFQKKLDLQGLEWERTLLHGSFEEALKDLVEKKGVELLILSTHGRTAMSRKKLGTNAIQVLRHLPCSALVLRPKSLIDSLFVVS